MNDPHTIKDFRDLVRQEMVEIQSERNTVVGRHFTITSSTLESALHTFLEQVDLQSELLKVANENKPMRYNNDPMNEDIEVNTTADAPVETAAPALEEAAPETTQEQSENGVEATEAAAEVAAPAPEVAEDSAAPEAEKEPVE